MKGETSWTALVYCPSLSAYNSLTFQRALRFINIITRLFLITIQFSNKPPLTCANTQWVKRLNNSSSQTLTTTTTTTTVNEVLQKLFQIYSSWPTFRPSSAIGRDHDHEQNETSLLATTKALKLIPFEVFSGVICWPIQKYKPQIYVLVCWFVELAQLISCLSPSFATTTIMLKMHP